MFHLSTPDHLQILLEVLLTASPGARVRVLTHGGGLDGGGQVEALAQRLGVEICRKAEAWNGGREPADLAVQLFSMAAEPDREEGRRIRRVFSSAPARSRIIVHGHNGSVWDGSRRARLLRLFLRPVLDRLRPRRNAQELNLVARRLAADPGYDLSCPPRPEEVLSRRSGKRRLILDSPTRVEQCAGTGNALKPDLLRAGAEEELYEGRYHFADLYDHRRDWDALLARYQGRRWRNMTRVGVEPAGKREPRPAALDIGCGTGGLAARLAAEGYAVTGVDCSRTSIAKARATFPGVVFRVVPFEELETLEERFDLITLSHVVEHARDDGALIRSARRLLTPGGKLYVEVPWLDPEPLRGRPFWYRQQDHYREYTKLGLYTLVAGAGLRVLAHEDSWGKEQEEGREPYQFLLATEESGWGTGEI